MNTPNINQKPKRVMSIEKFNRRSLRMFNDFMEISDNLARPLKDYEFTDANRNRMRNILNDPTKFSEEEKIDTLISFHKDTCANIMLRLYPSTRDEYRDEFEDLEILKRFEPVILALKHECQKTYCKHAYQHLRARKQQMQMRVSMSVYLKSSDAAALPEDIKNWMLRTLGCNDYSYDGCDNDEDRLEGLKSGISNRLAHLQSLGVDTSKYQYQDIDDRNPYLNFQPTRATIDEYMLLEEEITRRHDDLIQLSEDAHPFDRYLNSLKNNVQTLESVVNGYVRRSQKIDGPELNTQKDPDGLDGNGNGIRCRVI